MINTVIFDLDGTLLYTLEDLRDSLNHVLADHGQAPRSLDEVRQFIGNGSAALIARSLPLGKDDPSFKLCYDEYREYYAAHCAVKTRPYPGIVELVSGLKARGFTVAIVSNKPSAQVARLAEKFFPGMISATLGDEPGLARKPAPDAVDRMLKELGRGREEAVYVGDSDVDVRTAANAGMRGIIVTWGYREREYLKAQGAQCLIDEPEQLLAQLS